MKTAPKTFLFAFALLLSTFSASQANASDTPAKPVPAYGTSVYRAINGNIVLSLEKRVGNSLSVRVVGADGTKLTTQRVAKRLSTAQLRFDLRGLPDGAYTLEVSDGVRVTTHQITLKTPLEVSPARQIALN